MYNLVLRDKVAPEDPYLMLVKATAFAMQEGEPYVGRPPSRAIRDFLIKDVVVI